MLHPWSAIQYCAIIDLTDRLVLDNWKKANVLSIFKGKVKTDVNNYRPISIVPVIAKAFEKFVFDQF